MMQRFLVLALAVGCGLRAAAARSADEALLADGRRITGTLSLDRTGGLQFTAAGQMEPVAGNRLTLVRFPEATPAPFRVAGGLRVLLQDGQTLTGPLLRLDRESVVIRTAWAERLTVPRAAVAALTQLPGWQPIIEDSFRADCKERITRGKPVFQAEQAGTIALLSEPGQELIYTLTEPAAAGRVGINFQERDGPRLARWLLELTFRKEGKPRTVTVVLAGAGDGYPVKVSELEGTTGAVARSPGWHRLTVQFRSGSLRVLLDESALWYNLDRGPGGALQQVRLLCENSGETGRQAGAVALAEFNVALGVDEAARPSGDPNQDEVRLASGDQLFGEIVQADARTVTLEGRFGRRSLPWTAVRGCYPRRVVVRPPPQEGKPVRLWVRNGLTAEPDVIEGVVLALDERNLRLRNAWVGEAALERDRVRQVRPLGR